MSALIRLLALIVLAVLASGSLRAEQAPNQAPQLHIDATMHTGAIWDIDASADGKLLVTASDDKTLRLWSADTGELIKTFRVPISLGSEGRLYATAISPDGRFVATAGWDHAYWQNYWTPEAGHFVYLFDTISGALVKRLGPLPQVINVMDFSPDGAKLAVGMAGPSHGIRIWDVPSGTLAGYDMAFGDGVFGLDYSARGFLAVASMDGFVRLYGADNRLARKSAVPAGAQPRSLKFSPDGQVLAVSQINKPAIDFLDGLTLKPIGKPDTSTAKSNDLLAIGWSTDGTTFYAGGRFADSDWEYPIFAYRGTQMTVLRDKDNGPDGGVGDIVTLPGGRVAFSSQDTSFGIFDSSGKVIQPHRPIIADMRNKYSPYLTASPDASAVWFGLKIGTGDPWVFDLKQLSFVATPQSPPDFISAKTEGLPVENWLGAFLPTLNGQVLKLDPAEMSRSLAIAPDNQGFVIGTDWTVSRFGADGSRLWYKNTEGAVWGVNLAGNGEVVVAALGDGTLRWYRYSDGQELLAFFADTRDKKWIAWTPSGYYAASPGGEDLIGWHVNGLTFDAPPDFFPASRFRDQYYRPDIVQLVLNTKDEKTAVEQANATAGKTEQPETGVRDILPAVVEFAEDSLVIETQQEDVTIHYRVRSPSGRPITRIEVQIDGRPITPRSAVPVDEGDDAKAIQLNVPPRDSSVTLIAYIDDQPGVPVTLPIKWTGKAVSLAKPNLYGLMIGVSNYDNTDLKLRYAAKDAQDLAAAFEGQKGLYYNDVEITELLNADATEVAIEAALTKLRKKAKPDDIVVVFMAGHGVTNAAQDFYFLPSNVDMDPDMMEATAIDGDIIRKGLSRIPGKVILFMDACHAGNGIQGGQSVVDMTGLANGMSDGASIVMYASSTGRQVSYEGSQWENGAFTEALLSILNDPQDYGNDKLLSISELDEYLTEKVEELTEGKQTPVMTKPGAIKRFFLASL